MSRIRSIHTFTDREPGVSDANPDASVPFISLGEASQAVVMRLQSKLPRIKVASPHQRGWGTDGDSL